MEALRAIEVALNRLVRISGLILILIGLILLSNTAFFFIEAHTHAAQNEALSIILNQNRLRSN